MAGNTKPRKRYRPRIEKRDPITLAMGRVGKLPPAEVDDTMAGFVRAFQAMREGVGSEVQWCLLLGAVLVAKAIEELGVVRGLSEHLESARQALQAIEERAMVSGSWKPTALYWQEIENLDAFLPLHRFQLEQVSLGELRQANRRMLNLQGAGRAQVTAVDINPQLQQEQLQLLAGQA